MHGIPSFSPQHRLNSRNEVLLGNMRTRGTAAGEAAAAAAASSSSAAAAAAAAAEEVEEDEGDEEEETPPLPGAVFPPGGASSPGSNMMSTRTLCALFCAFSLPPNCLCEWMIPRATMCAIVTGWFRISRAELECKVARLRSANLCEKIYGSLLPGPGTVLYGYGGYSYS